MHASAKCYWNYWCRCPIYCMCLCCRALMLGILAGAVLWRQPDSVSEGGYSAAGPEQTHHFGLDWEPANHIAGVPHVHHLPPPQAQGRVRSICNLLVHHLSDCRNCFLGSALQNYQQGACHACLNPTVCLTRDQHEHIVAHATYNNTS